MLGTKPNQTKKDRRTQLYHHDNGDLEFVKRDIVGNSLTELNDNEEPLRSWIDYYQTLYPFDGYKGIPADNVQLAYGRHFHLEIHDILPDDIRPPEDMKMDSPFMSSIAEARAIEISKSKRPKSIYEKMTYILGAALILELLVWGIAFVAG